MPISDEDLEEFINRYEKAFGERLSSADATDMARRLIHLYKILLRPLPGERGGKDESKGTHTPSEG